MPRGRALILAGALAASGCAPRIDSSSPEKMAATMQTVRDSLPEDQRQKFDEAVMAVALKDVTGASLVPLAAQSPAQLPAEVSAKLNGKTALEVITESEAIAAERAAKEQAQALAETRAQALAEIKELETKRVSALAARVELAKFEVSRSRLRLVPRGYSSPQPVIEMSVKNGMSSAVSRAYFKGTVASPGRAVPWIKEDFSYSIEGGVEPGEVADWSVEPNRFSAWGKADVPLDAIFTVEVVRLDGPDGKVLYDSVFSDADAERLEKLKASFK